MTQKPTNNAPAKINFELPTIADLLEKGVHFGHEAKRWNPKMAEYIYTKRGGIHVIDLAQTSRNLESALNFLKGAARRGDVIFVGTKRQACEIVKNSALECGAHYVVGRWAGGVVTNYSVIRKSLKNLLKLEKQLLTGVENRTKQEVSWMKKEYDRLNRLYEGLKHLSSKPTAVVVVDAKRERIAIREARKAGIPVVALADTNVDPDLIDYIIPGNDDAIGSIELIMGLISQAILEGNEGKRLNAIRKSYEAELAGLKESADLRKTRLLAEQQREQEERQFAKVGAKVRIVEKEEKDEVPAKVKVKAATKKPVTQKKEISSLGLSSRIEKALESEKIDYASLRSMSAEELGDIKGVGPKALEEIMQAVSK